MLPESFPVRRIVNGLVRPHASWPVNTSPQVWHAGSMNEAAWAALMVSLTVVCALGTIRAFRSRGTASGIRGLAFTLLPVSAWLTGTLEMFTEIAGSVADWATGLVLNPLVWTGIGLFGTSALLFFTSGRMRARAPTVAQPAQLRPPLGHRRHPRSALVNAGRPGQRQPG